LAGKTNFDIGMFEKILLHNQQK